MWHRRLGSEGRQPLLEAVTVRGRGRTRTERRRLVSLEMPDLVSGGPIGQHAGPTIEATLTLARQPRPTPCHVPAALASRRLHVVPRFHPVPPASYPFVYLMWDPLLLQRAAGRKSGDVITSKRVLSHTVVSLSLRASLFIHLFCKSLSLSFHLLLHLLLFFSWLMLKSFSSLSQIDWCNKSLKP